MRFKNLSALSLLIIFFLSSCQDKTEPLFTTETVTRTLNGNDVYFIFTNTSLTDSAPVSASVNSSFSNERTLSNSLPNYDMEDQIPTGNESVILEKIADFNHSYKKSSGYLARSISSAPAPSLVTSPVDDIKDVSTDIFYIDISAPTDPNDPDDPYYGTDIAATCRYADTDTDNGVKLSIWVADDDWVDGTTGTITTDMISAIADKFLVDSSTDDIYKWVTDVYGVPWGSHGFTNLIASTEAQYITILLYDIDGDASTNGGTLGYFWSKDNFLNTEYSGSNQRIMFYIDSILYSTVRPSLNESSWSIDNYWPKEIISTLAHEFQHMIHFYQKQIKLDADYSDIWLNEMCSLVTEDFVADKLGIPGPRGIKNDYTEGSTSITDCRLSDFNYGNTESFLVWDYNGPVISDTIFNLV